MKKYLLVTSLILSSISISLYAQDNNASYDIVKQVADLARANEMTKLPPITPTKSVNNNNAPTNMADSVYNMLEKLKTNSENTRKTTLTYDEYMKVKQEVWGKNTNSKVKFYESK